MLCPKCQGLMDPQQTLDNFELYTCQSCQISLCVEDFSDRATDEAKAEAWKNWYPIHCPQCGEELDIVLYNETCPSCGEPRPAPKPPEPKDTYLEDPEQLRWCENCQKVLEEVVWPYTGDAVEAWNPETGRYEHGKDGGYELADHGECCPECHGEAVLAEPEEISLWEQARKVKVP